MRNQDVWPLHSARRARAAGERGRDVLVMYQEIRDRIFRPCREHGLRPDFPETTRTGRVLLVWNSGQEVVARAFIPTMSDPPPTVLARLQHDLTGIFGEGWME